MTYTREALGRLPLKGRPSCDVCGFPRPLYCTLRDDRGDRTDACRRCADDLLQRRRPRRSLRSSLRSCLRRLI
jgi:hypothetical protein